MTVNYDMFDDTFALGTIYLSWPVEGLNLAKVCIRDRTSAGVELWQGAIYLQPQPGGYSKPTLSSKISLEPLEFLLLLFVPNMFARFRKSVERPSAGTPAGSEAVRNPPACQEDPSNPPTQASHERTQEEEAFGLKLVEDGVDPIVE
jgi:hypothetical protein